MLQVQTKVTGDKEVMRKLQILSEKCDGKVEDIIRNTTIKVEGEAKKDCPVLTGRLRSSITHKLINKRKEHTGQVGTNVIYAPFVEFGTQKRKAKPYLFPALKTGNNYLKQKLTSEIKKIK